MSEEQVGGDRQEQDPEEAAAPDDTSAAPDATEGPSTGAKRQVTLAVPPIDRLLVMAGAAAMVLSGLLSWIEVGGFGSVRRDR